MSPTSLHRVAYVADNPINYIDPYGLDRKEFRAFTAEEVDKLYADREQALAGIYLVAPEIYIILYLWVRLAVL